MRFLLDTNVVSNLVRDPHGRVTDHIARVGEEHVGTSIIVAAELRYGAAKKGSSRLTAQLEKILADLDVIPFDVPADTFYGALRTRLEMAGRIIGANDLLIAAQALALECIVVTDNEQEFSRADGLQIENWLRDSPVVTPATGAPRARQATAANAAARRSPDHRLLPARAPGAAPGARPSDYCFR